MDKYYIELTVNATMKEEVKVTLNMLNEIIAHHPLTEEEAECLDMARFYLSRVNREMLYHTKERQSE